MKKFIRFICFWQTKKQHILEDATAGLSMFNRAIILLEENNTAVTDLFLKNEETIKQLKTEQSELGALQVKNSRVITNMKTLLGE